MPQQLLSTDYNDRCGREVLKVQSATSLVEIRKGETRENIDIPNRRFVWYCGETKEYATAPKGTNRITAIRASTGRNVTWEFYRYFPEPETCENCLLNDRPLPAERVFISEGIEIRFKSFRRYFLWFYECGSTVNIISNHIADQIIIKNTFHPHFDGSGGLVRSKSFGYTKGEALRENFNTMLGSHPSSFNSEITVIVNNIKIVSTTGWRR